jgi:predicted transcriptional regulator
MGAGEHEGEFAMKILMSIKPEYSSKIFSGEKKFEFRKQKPKHRLDTVYVYESQPTQKIVGWFRVTRIIPGSPDDIWNRCGKDGGIQKEDYFRYCRDKRIIYAFAIDKAVRYAFPIDPLELDRGFNPPQSYIYVNQKMESKILSMIIYSNNYLYF